MLSMKKLMVASGLALGLVCMSGFAAEPPAVPVTPSPADGADILDLSPKLSWAPCAGASEYKVSIWIDGKPTNTATVKTSSWTPEKLSWLKTYKWQVVASTSSGPTTGGVWTVATRPPVLPTPKKMTMGEGFMPLTAKSRIVVMDPSLEAHAAALQEELWCLTDWKLEIVKGSPAPGDIVIKINKEIRADEPILAAQNLKLVRTKDMAHTISVKDMIVVEGWDVRAVCEGTATVLLSIVDEKGKFSIPRMEVKDWPFADFTGTMIDCGRQWMPEDVLQVLVESCRFTKTRYIQLHVGDDQGYSMPSKAFPQLGTANGSCCEGVPPKKWDWDALVRLEAFAAARGVGIVPELETPGHSEAMARTLRDVFGGPGCMDMASEELYEGLDTVIGEMCNIFKSAPYFHMGCDEANAGGVGAGPSAAVYKRRHAIPRDSQSVRNAYELYVVHMKRVADIARKYGKLTIAYENFPDDGRLKDDIIAMVWYPNAVAQNFQAKGFATITVPWELGVPFHLWNIFHCNGSTLQRTDRVLGASGMMWQMSAVCVAGGWGQGTAARSERTWGPDTPLDYSEFGRRQGVVRERSDRFALPVKMTTEGIDGGRVIRCQHFLTGRMIFGGKLKVILSVAAPTGGQIRYTTDDSEVTPTSTLYTEPLVYQKTFMLNTALFFGDRKVGGTVRAKYDYFGIEGYITQWMIAGPYGEAGKSGSDLFNVEFPPEKGQPANWIPFKSEPEPEVPWMVNFDRYPGFSPGDNKVAYIKCQVFSPKAQDALLYVGTDDGVKVFINGKNVHGVNAGRGVTEEDRVGIKLNEGWNDVLIKDNNWTGGYAAKARIRSASDGILEGMKVKAE